MFKSIYSGCWYCEKKLVVVNQRDIIRKKFCSHACRQRWRFRQGEWDMKILWDKNNTPEVNAKKSRPGPLNGNWRDDRKTLKRPSTSYEGNRWRKAVYERDNYTCQLCGVRGGRLNADHIKPYALYPDLRLRLSNGRTLCVPCHKTTNTYGGRISNWKKRGIYVSIQVSETA